MLIDLPIVRGEENEGIVVDGIVFQCLDHFPHCIVNFPLNRNKIMR